MSTVHRSGAAPIGRTRTAGAVILRPSGVLDVFLADELRIQVLEAHAPVVIDLDACDLVESAALTILSSSWAMYRPAMHLVSTDESLRVQASAVDVRDPLPVHADVEAALAVVRASSS